MDKNSAMGELVEAGSGKDLVITVFNKRTKETIIMDAAGEGEQFILTMAKAGSQQVLVAKSCSNEFLISHLVNVAELNPLEFVVANKVANKMGLIDPEMAGKIKMRALKIDPSKDINEQVRQIFGSVDSPDSDGFDSIDFPLNGKKTPTIN